MTKHKYGKTLAHFKQLKQSVTTENGSCTINLYTIIPCIKMIFSDMSSFKVYCTKNKQKELICINACQ